MGKKITLLEVNNFKRVDSIKIEPGQHSLVLIGGNNTQGKSSLLGAMSAALGGKAEVPGQPIKSGEKQADIRIEFDDGELIVRRKFVGEKTVLEVKSNGEKIKSPQKMLDKLLGTRFMDPMAFTRLSAKDQRNALLSCVDIGIDLEKSYKDEKQAYEERRDINRELKKFQANIEKLGDIEDPGQDADSEEIRAQLAEATKKNNEHVKAKGDLDFAQTTLRIAKESLELAKKRFNDAAESVKEASDKLKETESRAEEIEQLTDKLQACSELAEQKAKWEQKKSFIEQADAASKTANALTDRIEELKVNRNQALSEAEMPVPGLDIGEKDVLFNGLPLEQASGAEKLLVAIGMANALSPELNDIWVQDGALLDTNSLEVLEEYAQENGLRVWLERVGESDDNSIIISDGRIR